LKGFFLFLFQIQCLAYRIFKSAHSFFCLTEISRTF